MLSRSQFGQSRVVWMLTLRYLIIRNGVKFRITFPKVNTHITIFSSSLREQQLFDQGRCRRPYNMTTIMIHGHIYTEVDPHSRERAQKHWDILRDVVTRTPELTRIVKKLDESIR
jgi:hypothetical protein